MWHVYEAVISNSLVWLKVQGSCESTEQAAAFFGCRFTGTDYTVDGKVPCNPVQALGTIPLRRELGVDCGPAPRRMG